MWKSLNFLLNGAPTGRSRRRCLLRLWNRREKDWHGWKEYLLSYALPVWPAKNWRRIKKVTFFKHLYWLGEISIRGKPEYILRAPSLIPPPLCVRSWSWPSLAFLTHGENIGDFFFSDETVILWQINFFSLKIMAEFDPFHFTNLEERAGQLRFHLRAELAAT